MLTIFTPTYNRAYSIDKLYDSLKNQTSNNFEWVVIDDGSTDNTEVLFKTYETVGKRIVFERQLHGGKHRAINNALKIASGEYFFIVDSDDYLTKDAVEKINEWISGIDSDKICGVAGIKISPEGRIWGGEPFVEKHEYIEATNLEREKFGLLGDKAEIYSTKVLKQHMFPEFENEFFVTEAVVWDKIGLEGYKLRWYNEPIYVCEYLDDGLTKNGANSREGHIANPKGFARYVGIEINAYGINKVWTLFVEYVQVAKIKKIPYGQRKRDLNINTVAYCKYLISSFYRRCERKIVYIMTNID